MINFGILTVSTTCSQHPELDSAGPKLELEIKNAFPDCQVTVKRIVGDDLDEICRVLELVASSGSCDVLFTVGGTGFSPSDVTPEATRRVLDKEASGLAYALISKSLGVTDMAMLSRPVCGIKHKTIILNFPGSAKAALECFGFVKGALPHAVALVKDEKSQIAKEHAVLQRENTKSKVRIQAGSSRLRQSPYPMLEVCEALKIIENSIDRFEGIEEISIEDTLYRVLAEDIKAPKPVPAFRASIKDGYAVRAADGPGERTVRAVAAAGGPVNFPHLEPGEVVRISTGAPVPPGADAVVQVEDTKLVKASSKGDDEEIVSICVAPKLGQDIREVGSDIRADTLVLKGRTLITPAYVGVLAMLGIPRVKVVKRPSIGIISTGNELVDFKAPLREGLIYDSNKITLLTLLRAHGYYAKDCGIARDSPDSVKTTLDTAFEGNDVIISSGGVSMGEYDLLKQVLLEDFQAEILVGRLNMKPGKPTVFARLNYRGKPKVIFALPGNPVSCCVTTLLLVVPALKHMELRPTFTNWPVVQVVLDHDVTNKDQRPEYVRVKVCSPLTGPLRASSTGNQISSRLNSMVDANALLLVRGNSQVKKGEYTPVLLFGPLSN